MSHFSESTVPSWKEGEILFASHCMKGIPACVKVWDESCGHVLSPAKNALISWDRPQCSQILIPHNQWWTGPFIFLCGCPRLFSWVLGFLAGCPGFTQDVINLFSILTHRFYVSSCPAQVSVHRALFFDTLSACVFPCPAFSGKPPHSSALFFLNLPWPCTIL